MHNTIYRWCVIELYTQILYNFINKCDPKKFNRNFKKMGTTGRKKEKAKSIFFTRATSKVFKVILIGPVHVSIVKAIPITRGWNTLIGQFWVCDHPWRECREVAGVGLPYTRGHGLSGSPQENRSTVTRKSKKHRMYYICFHLFSLWGRELWDRGEHEEGLGFWNWVQDRILPQGKILFFHFLSMR